MDETRYRLRIAIPLAYEQAVEHAAQALKAEAFGVLTTIDGKQTLKQKLDREFRKYIAGSKKGRTTTSTPARVFAGTVLVLHRYELLPRAPSPAQHDVIFQNHRQGATRR
jgi:hypothetical protein